MILMGAILAVGCTNETKAVYYPDRTDLTQFKSAIVDSVDACRAWVSQQAIRHDDRNIRRGDYVCVDSGGNKVR
jgi:hypothetical protein